MVAFNNLNSIRFHFIMKQSVAASSSVTTVSDYTMFDAVHAEGDYIKTSGGSVQRHGTGTHHSQDGSVYSGCWVNDVMCGQGEIRHTDGVTYKVCSCVGNHHHLYILITTDTYVCANLRTYMSGRLQACTYAVTSGKTQC